MNNIKLIEINVTLADELYLAHAEISENDNGFTNPAFGYDRIKFNDYVMKLIDYSSGKNLLPGYVAQTTFALVYENRVCGISRLRHALNDYLMKNGGHIGYFIRKEFRGFGHGNLILALTLEKAWQLGLDKVLLTVNSNNTISRNVILRNGGLFEKESIELGLCYYWIQKVT